ncbi:MAG: Zn-dependent oligopeptidase [Verrucomicrobia bacterium]|nr:Zn-dependent oligopeptidase [Verrucomicrobiota bacterium]
MNTYKYLAVAIPALGLLSLSYISTQPQKPNIHLVKSGLLQAPQDLSLLLPRTADEIHKRTDEVLADARSRISLITKIPDSARTYQNTMVEFDRLCAFSPFSIFRANLEIVSFVYPSDEMREAARQASTRLDAFAIDEISNNTQLFSAIKSYAAESKEPLSAEQRYFVSETVADFKRSGLDLPEETRAKISVRKKELADLTTAFGINIAKETKSVQVAKEELAGLEDDFIASLTQTEDGSYILTTDYPTYFGVMMHCSVEETRKALSRAFLNCGYPVNEGILKEIIAKRDELAKLLGFESYAHLNLDDQMCRHPQKVEEFLDELVRRSSVKADLEYKQLVSDLPESVQLTADGKIKSWDVGYLRTQYKQKHFSIDERVISEYFPMDQTLQSLLGIYEEFLGLSFQVKPAPSLWHEDVKFIEAYDASNNRLLGYLLLDLHPRPNKFTHACNLSFVPATANSCAVSLVIANFPKSTANKPALLQRGDVQTFFHEFGHAMHALLGRTETACFAGTRVKTDFVEMPSQMLEEWLWEKNVLQRISSHYVTGAPLPDELIDAILSARYIDIGSFLQRQALFSFISLRYYGEGAEKDVDAILRDLTTRICPQIAYDDESHLYASFGHLTDYGARYYGYMWSRVYGLDLFNTIKEQGMSREIGKRYVDTVLSKGGSKDPMELLVAFLGRQPEQEAFFKHLGE